MAFDVVGEGRFFAEFVEILVNFFQFALENDFNRAVGEIFDAAGEVKAFGELFAGVTKAHALDAAFEDGLTGDHDLTGR